MIKTLCFKVSIIIIPFIGHWLALPFLRSDVQNAFAIIALVALVLALKWELFGDGSPIDFIEFVPYILFVVCGTISFGYVLSAVVIMVVLARSAMWGIYAKRVEDGDGW